MRAWPWVISVMLWGACAGNEAPYFVAPPETHTGYVATRMDLTLFASDPDGDSLEFNMRPGSALGSSARLSPLSDRVVFSWTPAAADVGEHAIDFIVSDGTDSSTHTVRITVKAATDPNTAPTFRRPLNDGGVLDLAVTDTIAVDILVADPDSVDVEITQDPPIEGSSLKRVGQMAAVFKWTPDEEQRKTQQHLLRLWANDGDNKPVPKDFTIFIRRDLPTDCPGDDPVVAHTPPGSTQTFDDIVIQASVIDDQGLKDAPVLYVSTTDPGPDPDIAKMAPYPMAEKPGRLYEAAVANPVVGQPAGTTATLYYFIVAEDDDDATGDCDHRVQAPSSGTYQTNVTAPTQASTCGASKDCAPGEVCDQDVCKSDTCTPLDLDKDDFYFEQAGCPDGHFCPAAGEVVGPSHCALDCTEDADCGAGRACKIFDQVPGCAVTGVKIVGDACGDFTECADKLMCLGWKGGYCSLSDCDSTGSFSGPCPTGSACYPAPDDRFFFGTHYLCVKACFVDSDCRELEGYSCKDIVDDQGANTRACLP